MNKCNIVLIKCNIIMILSVLLLSIMAAADLSADLSVLSKEVTGQELSGAIGSLFGNENINVYIKDGGKTLTFALITKEKKVISLKEEELSDPTLKVFTDAQTITSIQSSSNLGEELKAAWKEERITYEAVGFWNKIKFSFTNFFVKLFGSIEEDDKVQKEDKAEIKEEKKTEKEEQKEEKTEVKGEKQEETKENETKESGVKEKEPKEKFHTYNLSLTNTGFNPATLKIKVGDMVEWKIVRSGNFKNGMILGTQNCANVKSKILNNGESFKWTFDKVQTCTIVDGIITTQVGKVIVE